MNRPESSSFAANVLRMLVAEGKVSATELAFLADRDVATIHRYLGGTEVIPVDVIRAAYEQTGDIRVLKLVAGRRLIKIEEPPSVTAVGDSQQSAVSDQQSVTDAYRRAISGGKSQSPPSQTAAPFSPPATPPRLPPAQQLMEHLAEAMERLVGSAGYAHKILTGPIVNDSDHQALANFRADCFCLIGLLGDAATLAERFAASRGGDCQRKKVRK